MFRILLLLFVFSVFGGSASPSFILQLYLNTDNCFSCESSLRELRVLNNSIPFEIHVLEKDKAILKEYLGKFDLEQKSYTIKFHKKIIFDRKQHGNSFFKLVVDGKTVSKFYGDVLYNYVRALNAMAARKDTSFSISLPDTNVFSNPTVFTQSDQIIITDTKLGKNIVYRISFSKNKAELVSKLFAKDLNYSNFFGLGGMDTSYRRLKREGLKLNTLATFGQCCMRNDRLYLQFTIPHYYILSANRFRSSTRSFLLERELDHLLDNFFYVKESVITDTNNNEYYLDATQAISFKEDKLVLPIYTQEHKDRELYRAVEMKKLKDTLIPGVLKHPLSAESIKKYRLNDGITFANSSVAYEVTRKIIYNYQKDELILDFADDRTGGLVMDVKLAGCFIQFVMVKGDKIRVLTYDRYTLKKLQDRKVIFAGKVNPFSVRIFFDHFLVALSEVGEKLYFTSL